LGPSWKKERLQYVRDALKYYPRDAYGDALVATDECLFILNNVSNVCKHEFRKRGAAPMQVKKVGYAPTVMVWAAIGKHYRHIVVHEEANEEEGDVVQQEWADRKDMVKKKRMDIKHIDPNRRYTKEELLRLSRCAQSEWLRVEWAWGTGRGKGVNRFDYCKRCLGPLVKSEALKHNHLILEDNAKIHTSNYATLYKEYHKLQMVEGHPAHSCDLNPCEFVWARLKESVSFKGPPTARSMADTIKKEFNSIPQRIVDLWIDTYWKRLEACAAHNGDWVGSRECRLPRTMRRKQNS
jgi:transposase